MNGSLLKRSFVLALSMAGWLAGAAEKPNIVFIIADQWRAQAFGYAGDENAATPNFDRLAGESVNFRHAVAGTPVCSPTRASLLTGQRPLTHGVFINDVPLATNAVTLARVLAGAGYDTACIGKWHVDGHGRSNFIPRERRQGFDYWKVLECTHAYSNSVYYGDGPEKLKWEGYDARAQAANAGEYLRGRAGSGRPFLLWLAWGPPHNPYETAPAELRARFPAAALHLRPNVPESSAGAARRDLTGYYAHGAALDEYFGGLWRTLREAGLEENTILVFTSDHGDMLYSHAEQRKQRPYEESVRVPMLVHWPAGLGKKGRVLDAPINSEDVMPTLLGLCGVTIPGTVEGLDFSAYLRGGPDPSDGAALLRCPAPFGEWSRRAGGREFRGLRTARYTFVRDLNGPWLLFDNESDPFQMKNLAGQPAVAAVQFGLESQLNRRLRAAGDEFRPAADYIRKWNYPVDANGTMPYTP